MPWRANLAARYGADVAKSVPLLYGGSVKPTNAAEIFALENVDGALVGGASLKAQDFGPHHHGLGRIRRGLNALNWPPQSVGSPDAPCLRCYHIAASPPNSSPRQEAARFGCHIQTRYRQYRQVPRPTGS